jgi:hypothetical protein
MSDWMEIDCREEGLETAAVDAIDFGSSVVAAAVALELEKLQAARCAAVGTAFEVSDDWVGRRKGNVSRDCPGVAVWTYLVPVRR